MSPLPGKVLASTNVQEPYRAGTPGELPQLNAGKNPSQQGMSKPTVPPGHAAAGMTAQPGANGPGVPRYPLGSRDR
jgi:hypothetical protein